MTPHYAGPRGLPCVILDVSVFGEQPGHRVIDHRCEWCRARDLSAEVGR